MNKQKKEYIQAFPASIVVLIIVIAPMLFLTRYSFQEFSAGTSIDASFTFENYYNFFTDAYYLGVLWTTIKIALICTILALILSFPVAYFLARSQSRFKSLYIILLIFPLMCGNVVRSAGWMIILGNAGFINSLLMGLGLTESSIRLLYTQTAVVIGTTAVVIPYLVLTLQSVIEGIDISIEEAARNLGAGRIKTFILISAPVIAPGIAAGTMLVFILCMNAYVTPVLLGGTSITMMAPTLYDQITRSMNWPFGSSIALILVIITLIVAVTSSWLINRRYVRTMQ